MAQGFDSNKATNDLKQLLNLDSSIKQNDMPSTDVADNNSSNASTTGMKKKTRRKGKSPGDKKDKNKCDTEASSNLNNVIKATTNSNGNALLTPVNTSQSDDLRSESSAPVVNTKDSKPSAKSKAKKEKVKKQLNISDNANSHLAGDEVNTQTQDQKQTVSLRVHTDSTPSFSSSQKDSAHLSEKQKMSNVEKNSSMTQEKSFAQENAGRNIGKTSASNANAARTKYTKLGEEELTPEFLCSLEPHKIHVLKKRNQRFPKAKFFCRLCDFHLDKIEDCDKHMQDNRHCRRKEVNEVDAILRQLPPPTPKQLNALSEALDEVTHKHGITEEEKDKRLKVVLRLEKFLREKIPDVILYMYGSSLTRMGLNTADINVDLNSTDENKKLTFLLKETYEVMKDRTDTGFSNVHSDFSATVPALLLTDTETGCIVTMTIHCYSAHCSSELLTLYSVFDERLRKLCVAFRYWAHVCGLDQQADGFIPPIALNIMVIYFLQHLAPPLAPAIVPPKVSGEERGDFRKDAPAFLKLRGKVMKGQAMNRNTMTIGELWLLLLKFYSIEFDTANEIVCIRPAPNISRNIKPWNSKKLAVEDPYMLKKNVTRMVNNTQIYEYWQDCIRKAYHYFGLPRDKEGKSLIANTELETAPKSQPEATGVSDKSKVRESSPSEASTKDSDSSNSSHDQRSQSRVVVPPHPLLKTSSQSTDSTCSQGSTQDTPEDVSKNLSLKRNSDSDSPGVNEMSGTSQQSDDIEIDVENSPPDIHGPPSDITKITQDDTPPERETKTSEETLDEVVCSIEGGVNDLNLKTFTPNSEPSKLDSPSSSSSVSQHSDDSPSSDTKLPDSSVSDKTTKQADRDSNFRVSSDLVDSPCIPFIAQIDCFYEFGKDVLTDGKGPTLVCTTCEKEGHLKNSCPEDELPPVLPLPAMTPHHHKVLEETINLVPYEVGLSKDSIQRRQHFINCLEKFIKFHFADAQLRLFGSSCNGFGFERSDMDICMTFSRRGPYFDKVRVIERLAQVLRQYDELQSVQAISTAKVPIVKFTVQGLDLEGDISLYNILAQENTRLLWCYSQIDPRVKTLGYTIKTFAKVCDIGDASRGSLSSYAYILMMLYYLQQVKPAVIPVLQELYTGDKKPTHMVEDCDAWFMDNLDLLPKFWPEMGKNKMSVAELWLGFLRFYVEEFNYKEFVVSIKQKELLTRFDKLWNGSSIAIEDPFDLSHNLGSGLTRNMNTFIFKTFINGRMLYGSPIDDNMEMFKKYQNPSDYFFDTELLSESRPPNVRGCRRCGKIGHMARHCPHSKKDKEEERKKQQTKQQEPQPPPHSQSQQANVRYPNQQTQDKQPQQQRHQPQNQPSRSHHHQQQQQQQQQHHHPQQHQQQQYRQSPKPASQQQRHQQRSHQKQMQMERDWREREYRHNSSNNNNSNAMRGTSASEPQSAFNMFLNSHPGLVPSTPRGLARAQDQAQHPPMQAPRMPMPNRFPPPSGPAQGHGHHGNSSKLPPSLMSSSPRPTMPGVYYAPYSDPPPGHNPTFRMPPPQANIYGDPSRSAPPGFAGRPYNMQQPMNPVVQSLFASTQGQVLDVRSMGPPNQPKKL